MSNLKVSNYSMHEGEYNLASMFRRTIVEAFNKHPNENKTFVAAKLGLSERSLYNMINYFKIDIKVQYA